MYIPAAFEVHDLSQLHDFIDQYSFGTMVSHHQGEMIASHLPLLLDRSRAPFGTVSGHVARANPQWNELAGQRVLLIFSGPHAYISPTWYEEVNTVPTWNYEIVHVTGMARVIDDSKELASVVDRLVTRHERNLSPPWQFDANTEFSKRLLAQIVGFTVEIERIEGKWKLNQNHTETRRKRVIAALEQFPDDNRQGIARSMRQTLGNDLESR